MLKDRLYCGAADSRERRSAQTAFLVIIKELAQLVAPILVFTSEEIWEYLPEQVRTEKSVHFSTWDELPQRYWDEDLDRRWDEFLEIRRVAAKGLELARTDKVIGASNEARLVLYADEAKRNTLESFARICACCLSYPKWRLRTWQKLKIPCTASLAWRWTFSRPVGRSANAAGSTSRN